MKTISRIVIGAAAVMLLVATLQPAEAACAVPRLLDNRGAYLVSNPNWGGAGGDGTCTYNGCYLSESGGGPISPNFAGVFWGFDTTAGVSAANPAFAAGIDNGSWGIENWTKAGVYAGADPYYYPGFLTLPGGAYSQSGNPANWSFPTDGCPTDIDPGSCTCILLTDEWAGEGYFLVDSAITNAAQNYDFIFPTGAMNLQPIPKPEVTLSERDPASGDVTLTINVPDITGTAADYREAGCDCGIGFLVYQQIVGRGGAAPTNRSVCTPEAVQLPASDPGFLAACTAAGLNWIPAPSATGEAQQPTPFTGGRVSTSIKVDCDPATQQDVYLSTVLVEPSGLAGGNGSANSFRIECGANLAEPERPDRGRGRSGDAPRGRGENRGQRDR
jgi:hypothetical protein